MAASLVGVAVAWGAAHAQPPTATSSWRPAALPKAPPVVSFEKPGGAAAPASQSTWPAQPALPNLTPSPIELLALQQPGAGKQPSPADQGAEYTFMLEPPGRDRLFRLDSEGALFERMQQEARQRSPGERLTFPDEKPVTNQRFVARNWTPMQMLVEPNYVCYDRLYFEEKNSERYGWDLGAISPLVSAATFYKDLALWPYHAFTDPCRRYECSAGYCLPGDPVPYLWYPPQWSLTGLMAEAGAAIGLAYAIP